MLSEKAHIANKERNAAMKLEIQLFAGLVDLLGTPLLTLHIEAESITVRELKAHLTEKFPAAMNALESSFFAKNQAYAGDDAALTEKDEIALIPPVSGGQSNPKYVITYDSIIAEEVSAKVNHPNHGASLAFIGTTREFTFGQKTVLLEYEAYIPMAVKTMEQIGAELEERWPGALCAITHRLGKVGIGETSVVIAVSAPHRNDCYEASRYAIERLKQIVPIWKKEIWEDGAEWKGHQLGPWNPTIASPMEPKE
jgi:molybdopterin converting factor subunit 1